MKGYYLLAIERSGSPCGVGKLLYRGSFATEKVAVAQRDKFFKKRFPFVKIHPQKDNGRMEVVERDYFGGFVAVWRATIEYFPIHSATVEI